MLTFSMKREFTLFFYLYSFIHCAPETKKEVFSFISTAAKQLINFSRYLSKVQ